MSKFSLMLFIAEVLFVETFFVIFPNIPSLNNSCTQTCAKDKNKNHFWCALIAASVIEKYCCSALFR